MFTLAHASDWHATSLEGVRPSQLVGKRLMGWVSWRQRRQQRHRPEILRALFADLRRQAPDHVAITGDLTNVSLPDEFEAAASLLADLGSPEWVSLVPGNHDAYVHVPRAHGWALWSHYMASDAVRQSAAVRLDGDGEKSPVPVDFPTVRTRGPIALVGVCTALPTLPGLASGRVGEAQLKVLGARLKNLAARGLFRVVMIHHPVNDAGYTRRRRLSDSAALRAVLKEAGAELVLHGHGHRRQISHVEGPSGSIPAIGVRSASHGPYPEKRRAQYHVYRIEEDGGRGFRVVLSTRGYEPESGTFVAEGEVAL